MISDIYYSYTQLYKVVLKNIYVIYTPHSALKYGFIYINPYIIYIYVYTLKYGFIYI